MKATPYQLVAKPAKAQANENEPTERKGQQMRANARPRKPIDWEVVRGMLFVLATQHEIVTYLGISTDTLHKRCKRELGVSFTELAEQKRQETKIQLRKAQLAVALDPKHRSHGTMLIWLGKQYLGQNEKKQLTGKNNGPIQVERSERQMSDEQLERELRAYLAGGKDAAAVTNSAREVSPAGNASFGRSKSSS